MAQAGAETQKDHTAVTKWLVSHNGAEFIDKFYDKGYYDTEDVTAEVITAIVSKTKPGLAARLQKSLAALSATDPAVLAASPVTQWLEREDAKSFAEAFYRKGYKRMDEVTAAVIDDIVGAKQSGLAAKLKSSLAAINTPDVPAAELNKSAVTAWLRESQGGEYAQEFYRRGYHRVKDVTEAIVDAIVKKSGIAERLKKTLKDWDTPDAPPIPAGTPVDLEYGKITVDATGTEFKLPTELSTKATDGDVQSASKLPEAEWPIIATASGMLYGLNMDKEMYSRPFSVPKRVRRWTMPEGKGFFRDLHQTGEVKSTVTLTQETASYVTSGFQSVTASASYAFAAASFSREKKEKQSNSSMQKTLRMIGLWRYPRVLVDLNECTTVSPAFVREVTDAVNSADAFAALGRVFDRYGHAVPEKVVLGGQLFFEHVQTIQGSFNKAEVENGIAGAVSAKGLGATASTAVIFKNARGEEVSSQSIADSQTFRATGGNTLRASTPATWADTVNKPHLWAVIEYEGVKSTIDLLPGDLQRRVREVWTEHVVQTSGLFGETTAKNLETAFQAKTDGFLLGVIHTPTDEDDGGRAFFLGFTDAKESPTSMRGAASVHYYPRSDRYGSRGSFCMPVRKNQFARAHSYPTWKNPTATLFHVPFAVGDEILQEWGSMLPDTSVVNAFTDGLIVGTIVAGNKTRGRVVLKDGSTGAILGAASAHHYVNNDVWYQGSSFCVPVRKDQPLAFEVTNGYGKPRVEISSVPISGRSIGAATERDVSIDYTAREAGFLVVCLEAADEGRATIDVTVNGTLMATTAVHYYENHDTFLTHNTATVPISIGNQYRVGFWGTGNISRRVYFVPMR